MMRAQSWRVAVVAALLGLLAALSPAVASGFAQLDARAAVTGSDGATRLEAAQPSALVGDAVRSARPAAVRGQAPDRAPTQHLGGGAVAALLLLLAVAALAVAVRRSSWCPPPTAGARPAAPRAPPALASC